MPIFTPEEILRRQRALAARIETDCVVIPSFYNSFYASGFPMRQFGRYAVTILFRDADPVLLVPEFEADGAAEHSPFADIRTYDDSGRPLDVISRALVEVLTERRVQTVGIEAEGTPAALLTRLQDQLPATPFVDQTSHVDDVRIVSSEEELSFLRKAAQIADAGMAHLLATVEAGVLETSLVAGAYRAMEPMVTAGLDVQTFCYMQQDERSAQCHASAMPVPIGRAGFVELYVECQVWHYQVSIERPVLLGKPGDVLMRTYSAALEAFHGARNAVRPGATFSSVDAVSRRIFEKAGFPNVMGGAGLVRNVLHHTGGRLPDGEMRAYNGRELEAGMSLTIEPWSLVPGVGGPRFCDPIIVTEAGFESISRTPAEVLAVGGLKGVLV